MLRVRSFVLLFVILSTLGLNAQNRWKQYTTNNGLVSNIIQDVFIQDSLNIWAGTNNGLSLINQNLITNYNSNNTILNNNNIKKVVFAVGEIWVQTGSGVSMFNGRDFINYTSSNGLLSNTVYDLAVDTLGNLWIATDQGISMYDGIQFHNDSGKIARSIEVDENNNVYILRYSAIFNIPTITNPVYEIFDGNNWITHALTFNFTMSGVRLKKTSSKELVIVGLNTKFFVKVGYPFNLTRIFPTWGGQLLNGFNNIDIDHNLRTWISSNNNSQNLFVGKDTVINPFVFNPIIQSFKQLESNHGIIAAGDANGLYVGKNDLIPKKTELSLDINNIKASVNALGNLFTSENNSSPGFEYPKDSSTYLINDANFLIQSKIRGGRMLVYPNDPASLDKIPGPIESNVISNGIYISKVSRNDIQRHRQLFLNPNYRTIEGINDWPAVVSASDSSSIGAPFVDFNNNKIYDPGNGDYPIIKGDQAIFWINHPQDSTVKLEFHGMIYAYAGITNSPINNSIFLRYKIINKANFNLDSVKIGFYADTDIGYFQDDYVGCDSLFNMMFSYNGDSFDESIGNRKGFGQQIPSIGFHFLSDSMDSFIRSPNPSTPPFNSYWQYALNGMNYQNNPILYPNTTSVTKLMLTGDPHLNTGWTELSQGVPPRDRSILGSIPYICLMKDSSKVIDMSIGVNANVNNTSLGGKIPDLIADLNSLKPVYDSTSFVNFSGNNSCYLVTNINPIEKYNSNEFFISPNPAANEITVHSENDIQEIGLMDIRGKLLFTKQVNNVREISIQINSELSNGIYFIRIYSSGVIQNQKLLIQR